MVDFEAYRDIFTLPDEGPEGESYSGKRIGDVFLIAMNVSRTFRSWNINANTRGKFTELAAELDNPDEWFFGEHLSPRPSRRGRCSTVWLVKTPKSPESRTGNYRVVMFHQTAHGPGGHAVPVLTDPGMHLV